MSLKRVVALAALAVLVLPVAVLADGVNLGFGSGQFDASGTTSAGLALTNQFGAGIIANLDFLGGLPNPPGPNFVGTNFGFVSITTGQLDTVNSTATTTYFLTGGTFTIVSGVDLATLTGCSASPPSPNCIPTGTTLFSGTFAPITPSTPGPNPGNVPAGVGAVWSVLSGSGGIGSTYRLYGALIGSIDPVLLAFLGQPIQPNAVGFTANIDMLYLDNNGTPVFSITHGDAQVFVPEPATLVLFGSGLLGIAGLVRRKLAA